MSQHQADPRDLLRMLVSTVQLLAADYDEQIAALPDFVDIPDELALNLGDTIVLLPRIKEARLVDDHAEAQLQELHEMLHSMPEWTLEAVHSHPAWAAVRQKARDVLELMNQPRGPIDLSWGTYVPGKRSSDTA